jgi:hypothetical protein
MSEDSKEAIDQLLTVIQVFLVAFKALGTLDWSWWWVFSPLWVGIALAAAGALISVTSSAGSKTTPPPRQSDRD